LAEQTHARLEQAVQAVREAFDIEQHALAKAQAECDTLTTQPRPATIEQEAKGNRADTVRRYQALRAECQERAAALAELERLLRAPEQTTDELTEAVVSLLEAVVTLDREAVVRRLSAELEHIRVWFERLGTAADAHAGEIAEWSQRIGRPVRAPQIAFSWPPASAWQALLAAAVEPPTLEWDDAPRASGA